MPGLVGSRDTEGKAWNALAPELAASTLAETRRMALDALAGLPPGQVLATGTGVPSLVARVAWLRPRRPRTRADQVAWAVAEAAVLGLTGLGGLASYARLLLAGDTAAAGAALAQLLPAPVDHVLVQADLTAVAPGPLESALARTLQLVADVESRGGATVYRFTPGSVRRALDTGWSAAEIHDFLGSVSRTPVPQPLTYLVDDTARTFGTVRVGYAEAFLRADDEAALTELRAPPAGRLARAAAARADRGGHRHPDRRAAARGCASSARPRWWRPPTARSGWPGPTRCAPAPRGTGAGPPCARRTRPRRSPRSWGRCAPATGRRRRPRHPPCRRRAQPQRLAHRAARGGRGRHHRGHRLRRQPRHQLRAGRRPGAGRGRLAHRARPPQRRRADVRGAPDHRRAPARRLLSRGSAARAPGRP